MKNADWKVDLLRLTLFTEEPVSPDPGWWVAATGEQPETSNVNPRQGTLHEEGSLNDAKIVVDTAVNRIDLRLHPADAQGPPLIEDLGDINDRLTVFDCLVASVLVYDRLPSVLRIAFGAVLLAQVQDVRAGHELLNEYLSDLNLNSQTSADVLYRVNKPQKQLVEDREFLINRISTWTVVTRQQVLIAIGGNSPVFQSPNPPIAARLELDINTALQSDLISPALLAKIYSSLIEQGRTIAAEGDIE